MRTENHKAVRRRILEVLYEAYLDDPLAMIEPETLFEAAPIERGNIVPNIHYLADRKLVEIMMGYQPPMFSATRITAAGIDLVENRFEFNRQFPEAAEHGPEAAIPRLLEQLVEEGDFLPVDGAARRQLLGDILYLREELSLPPERWRRAIVQAVLEGIEESSTRARHPMDALSRLSAAVAAILDARI